MRNRSKKNLVFGTSLVVFAILLLLSSVNAIQWSMFRLAVSILAISYGVVSLFSRNIYVGVFSIFFGFNYSPQILEKYIDLRLVGAWQYFLIAFILALGLDMLFGNRRRYKKKPKVFTYANTHNNSSTHYNNTDDLVGEYVSASVSMGESTRYIYSSNLKEAELSSHLGSLSVYFNEVDLNNDLEIFVDCKLGNLELYLPRDWNVSENISTQLGSVELQSNFPDSPYIVKISGNVSLGNIEIRFI